MQFRILGSIEVVRDGDAIPLGGPKQRAVLALLLLHANEVVSTDRLIDELWGDEPPQAARNALQSYVSRLRGALGDDTLIEGKPPGYRIRVEPDELDTLQFESLVQDGHDLVDRDPAGAATVLHEALQLWRGPPLADLEGSFATTGAIVRLEELRLWALEGRIDADLALGGDDELAAELEELLEKHPFRERMWSRLMLALYRAGRQAEALAAYQRARSTLVEELGLDPSPELQELEGRILRQDPALAVPAQPIRGYRLLEQIGEGSFGTVHRAFQVPVGREVAVKTIHAELANDRSFIRRFEAEAQLVARLEHPHIVPLYDYWRGPGQAHLVMRWLRGGSLEEALGAGPINLERTVEIIGQVATGLSAAHRQGVVHRDVKPANVLLDEEGNAYLSDFGIAIESVRAESPPDDRTSPYLSPEQIRQEPATSRSDVYGLGVMLFEALTGTRPRAPDSLPPVTSLRPDVPDSVVEVISRATAIDPADRYADADTFARDLGRATIAREIIPAPVVNPYKGLRPFDEADAIDFFGRESLNEGMLSRLRARGSLARFLCLVGASGSGKSSAVRAGLFPALRLGAVPGSDEWFFLEITPGPEPMREIVTALLQIAAEPPSNLLEELEGDERGLARAVNRVLPTGTSQLVLLVDQFEELFVLVDDEERRSHFIRSLVAAVNDPQSRLRVVITLRADFYDRPLRYEGLAELVRSGTETVVPLSPEELERAIAGPSRRVGVAYEPGLVAKMVSNVSGRPGALPLLQYALTELFERKEDATLTLEGYRQIGGVFGAVARRAENIYETEDEPGRRATHQLFLRLVEVGESVGTTRRRVNRMELASLEVDQPTLDRLIEAYGQHRLLSFDRDPETREPTVELAHEALIGAWGRLGEWIDAARGDLAMSRRLAMARREWESADGDPSFLLTGKRLVLFEAWTEGSGVVLADPERAYLEASGAQQEAERAEEERRREHERALEKRSRRRLRALVAVLAVATLVAGALTAIAFQQRQTARSQAAVAEEQARIATARELSTAARANLGVDPDLSINLALEAVAITFAEGGRALREAEEALHEAVQASRVVYRLPGLRGVAYSLDGRFIATAPASGVLISDAHTGQELMQLPLAGPAGLAFSPDGALLAIADSASEVILWDTATGQRTASFVSEAGPVEVVTFSPDGKLLAALTSEGPAVVWDVESGVEIVGVTGADGIGLDFSSDGQLLAVVNGAETALYEMPSGKEAGVIPGDGRNAVFSPDDLLVATTGFEGIASIWDRASGRLLYALVGHDGHVNAVVFNPDGRTVATGGHGGRARIWDVASGRQMVAIAGQRASVDVLAFNADGTRLASGSSTGTIVWDVAPTGTRDALAFAAHDGGIPNVTYSPDGTLIATAGFDGLATVWDASTGRRRFDLATHQGPVSDVEFGPDGSTLATSSFDGTAKLWDSSGRELLTLEGHTAGVWAVTFSPDGTHLATVSEDGTGRVWDLTSGETISVFAGHTDFVYDAAWSPDGSVVVSVSNDFTGRIWDPASGEELAILAGHEENIVEQAFSPDGQRIATAGFDGIARVWDVASGEEVLALEGHGGIVVDVEASPDGSRWATASTDRSARIWDAATGRELLAFTDQPTAVLRLAFSPDGRWLAATGEDGVVRIYALDLEELIDIARDRVSRPLTQAECRQYLHREEC